MTVEPAPFDFPQGKEAYVREMFSRIAGRYDLLNRLLSVRRDVAWRRRAAALAGCGPGSRVLDVATGTGDLAFELARRVGETGEVVGVDFVPDMLALAERKAARRAEGRRCRFLLANAMSLPFPDASFDAATIAFGLRNLADFAGGLSEMRRVVRPGGRVVVLELSTPVWPGLRQVYRWYFHRVVPSIGRWVQGIAGPYDYLPESVRRFPDQESLAALMVASGLVDVEYVNLTGGIAAVHVGRVASPSKVAD
ncbi:MAG TPA: bifunctional demethylmenaquinone methyltransferase/2-methoxy-6-polyprenyl-1,4-benzoquinol methylase UbiE [Limnochordia bacterium]